MFCIIFDILVFWGAYNMIQWEYGGQTAQFYSETQTEQKKQMHSVTDANNYMNKKYAILMFVI